ncbi:putative vacuolar protein sorting-associated protein 13C [Senna tora]|uniref:Putative vacuolar protein sorting-associated protein 13C n=1 Tax=Senna tora TaxID=362788 RepID=A0A834W642_9FABA|nr:putative vacuolar protein sorting-associated protein 13C [Senna tora]
MPFKSIIRRRLLSLLQPWLLEEPEFHLKLGFIQSFAVAENLRLNVSALNQLFDVPALLFFKDVSIERLSIQFSNWYAPAFSIEVHGVHVVLSFQLQEEEGHLRRLRTSNYDYSESVRKKLSALDPEGCALHHLLERILFAAPSRKDFSTSFVNLLLKHCHLEVHHIHVEVQFPILNDVFMCFGELEEFNARSKYLDNRCLIRGLLSTVFLPMNESSYILNGIGLKVGLSDKECTDRVLLSSDLCTVIKLSDLQLADCSLCFPELAFSLSPDDISIYLAFDKLLSNQYTHARSPRELWRLASSRIDNVTVTPRFSLHKLVGMIGQWIRYIDAYENLLLLIEYSSGHLLNGSICKISKNKLILSSARYHWNVIADTEKLLPVEGIALARRVARHRAALKVQSVGEKCLATTPFNFLHPVFSIMVLIWNLILKIIHAVANVLFFRKEIVKDPCIDEGVGSLTKDPCQSRCFILNFGKIIITVSQNTKIQPSSFDKLQAHTGISYADLLSISFCIEALLLVYVEDIFKQRVSLSCGNIKVLPASLKVSSESSKTNMLSSEKEHRKVGINDMEAILWVEPAKLFLISDANDTKAEGSCAFHMESFLGHICSNWNEICNSFIESEIEYSENPSLLCKVERSFTYPGLKNPDFGFYECGLILGKLNLVLGHSSVSSVCLLLSQIRHSFRWEDKGKTSIDSNSIDRISWVNKFEFYAKHSIMALLEMLPEKQIHLGVFVDGPSVRFLHDKDANLGGQEINNIVSLDNFDLTFDFHEIEVAIGSPSLLGMSPLVDHLGFDDAETECLMLEPQAVEIPKPKNDKYACWGKISIGFYLRLNGLTACLGKSAEKHQFQLFELKPIAVQISSFREYMYSLSTTIVAFSAALGVMAGGLTILSFLDELYMINQAFASLYAKVSYLFSCSEVVDYTHPEFMRQQELFAESESGEAAIGTALLPNYSCLFLFKGNCRFKSVDVILHNCRTSGNIDSCVKNFDFLTGNMLSKKKFPDCGIWVSIQQTTISISCEEGKVDFLADSSGIMLLVFEYPKHIGKNNDHIVLENMVLESVNSVNCLHEISLSDCIFTLCLAPPNASSPDKSETLRIPGGNISCLVQDTDLTIHSGRSKHQSLRFGKEMASGTDALMKSSEVYWLLINLAVGNVFIGRCSMKKNLIQAHQLNKLLSFLSIGTEFQMVSWEIQGGLFVLETTSLAMAIDNYSSYLHCIGSLASAAQRNNRCIKAEHSEANNNLSVENDQDTVCTSHQTERGLPNTFALSLSHCALVFVHENDSGEIQEIVLEIDMHIKIELASTGRKLTFDLSRLSILSQVLHKIMEDKTEIPHFSSVSLKESSTHSASGGSFSGWQNLGELNLLSDTSSSRDHVPLEKFRQNHILKDFRAFISLGKPENGSLHLSQYWFGSCSLPGFDMTLSLSEIQTIVSMASSLSGISSLKTSKELNQNHGSTGHELNNSLEAIVPDGAIVAIQDVNQHMYITVKGEEKNFSVGGTIHYSLVGKRALFRVKYCTQRRWKSTVQWFSLISLYAKNNMGVPLRLNYNPGSCFVDISSTSDEGCTLWKAHPLRGEDSEVSEWETCNQLVNRSLYLVNKKNDSAVAFVDGVLEFVRKPGNPIKFKVFHDLSVALDVTEAANYPRMAFPSSPHLNEESLAWLSGKLPHIDIKIEKISLNIVHELSDTEDFFPLIRAGINNTQLIVQNLYTKSRVICTSSAVIHYFDAQRNLWGDLLRPVEIIFFYRSNYQTQRSEYASPAVPVNFYCRTKELDIYLSELSLDVLLFMIGKLNLSGPYSLRSSMILANYCKVENQSGLNLLFHFNQQRVTIARKQSTSILVRKLSDFTNQDLDAAASISIQLADFGSFVTSSIHLSLSQARTLAWRTRIMSMEGSRTYPGPFLVVDISRKSEDGLSVAVSPLVIIHNETALSMELKFQRSQPKEDEFASVSIKPGDSIDDSMAMFDAIKFSKGVKRALMSLTVGNFLFSFRPEMAEDMINLKGSLSVEWSDCIKGGKAIHLSGIFDKLNYRVRKALFVKSVKYSFSTARCILKSEGVCIGDMYFLIQTISRDVPVVSPEKSSVVFKNENSPVSLQEQKDIYILPTVRVTNLLHSDIEVLLSETDQSNSFGNDNIGKHAKISCGSTVDFYANPAVIYFTVTLTASNSSSKPVNSGDCVKLLQQNGDARYLDINLDLDGGKFFSTLRLYRENRSFIEAVVFTSYAMKNETDFPIYVLATKRRPLSRIELDSLNSSIPLELGLCLPPKSTRSWFLKSKKVQLKLLEDYKSEALLDLDSLSGLTEISFYKEEGSEIRSIIKLGVSTGPSSGKIAVPSQMVTLVPRYVICNESEGCIAVRQCYLQDDMAGIITIDSKQRTTLQLKEGFGQKREYSLFEHFIRKHRSSSDNSLLYIQIKANDPGIGWSGPVCIASLGRFFLKFRKLTNNLTIPDSHMTQFAAVHVVEEGSTLVLHFYKPPNLSLPYRIENCLHDLSITYYQKGSSEPEVLGSACSADYVWDDLTLPHRLVVRINDSLQLREIKLDKVRSWKPFYKVGQQRVLAPRLLLDKRLGDQRASLSGLNGMEIAKVGYEIYAEGPTRVLRICEISDSFKRDTVLDLCAKMQLRISQFAVHLLEHAKQDGDENDPTDLTPIVVAKLGNLNWNTVSNNHQKHNQFSVQYLNLELKWNGAPFASMLRRPQLDYSESNDCVLKVVFVLLTSTSNIKQFRYSSVFLQPIDLNLDEETLMKIASFWRTSLSNSESQRFYFDHFEIHPIKITANFIPGDAHSSYSSAQETLRSLLHSVIKVPPIKNMVVELNGVLITHALITVRELMIKCAQHYSWYAMRAIYIAKGSPLLPPDFVSIFDDMASSSLDVFFDPSRGLTNLPGLTLGTFKFISKCIQGGGFSGTKRYFGDLGKTLRSAGSNVAFAAVAEISDSVLKGAEANGFNGMVSGFHQGILKLAMEPSFLGTALMEGGPDRKITLDQSPGVDELYIEGYIQAMLDTVYRQEYLRVRVIDNQVILKNLPPNHSLINEIMERVKEFLVSKALLKGDPSTTSRPLRHLRGESEWKIGPTVVTLCEHLFVSFAIRMLRRQANKFILSIKWEKQSEVGKQAPDSANSSQKEHKAIFIRKWGISKFVLSGILAYIDGRLCRYIPNPVARRVVSGFLLSYIDQNDDK